MDKREIPDIVLVYPNNFPEEIIENEREQFETSNLNLKIQRNEDDTFMAFEWIIPTSFAAYILKPYFDSFLGDSYEIDPGIPV
ncbi:hypothetical protein [Aquimarina algiphila]|uniref:hypothetical protein n=1 Tax=Aquimarina algiphila TaxID=2047982 RepID=UPI00232AA601|nr:hypothetical protein [Aquimarina algiphila]